MLALAACDSGNAATQRPTPHPAVERRPAPAPVSPPTISWQGLTATIVVAEPAWRRVRATLEVRVMPSDGDAPVVVRIEARDLPAGSRLAVGAATGVAAGGRTSVEVPLPDLGAIEIAALERPVDLALGMPIELTLPDQPPVTTAVPSAAVKLTLPLRHALERVTAGPVRLSAAPSPLDTAVLVGHSVLPQRIGSGKTLGDLDWIVAVERRPTERTKVCKGYQRVGAITVRFVDQALTIYDARTGAVVATEVMAPPARCPRFAMVRDREASESVSTDDIKRRVAQRLARGNARRAR